MGIGELFKKKPPKELEDYLYRWAREIGDMPEHLFKMEFFDGGHNAGGSNDKGERIKFNKKSIDIYLWNQKMKSIDEKYLNITKCWQDKNGTQIFFDSYKLEADSYYMDFIKFEDDRVINSIVKLISTKSKYPKLFFEIFVFKDETKDLAAKSFFNNIHNKLKTIGLIYIEELDNEIIFKLKNSEEIELNKGHFEILKRMKMDSEEYRKVLYTPFMYLTYFEDFIAINFWGTTDKYVTKDKKHLLTENEKFVLLFNEIKAIKPINKIDIRNIRGEKKAFRLIIQLINDFKVSTSEILSDSYYKTYKWLPDEIDELVIYRAWLDVEGPKSYKGVIEFFNQLLVSSHGVSVDWKYNDEDILVQLNNNQVITDHGIEFLCSEHNWDEQFDIVIEKNGNSIDQFSFIYEKDTHNAKDLINIINKHLEKERITIWDADNGSDSFKFIVVSQDDLKELLDKYGNLLPQIISPIAKIK
jgi:hypothetical protein